MTVDFDHISSFDTPEESPGFLLWRTSILWRRAIEGVLKDFSLTHPQFVILATTGWLTKEGKKVRQNEIAKQAGLDPNTTSQILRGLQAKGLIKRVNSVDDRSKCPTLTTKGKQVLEKALPAVERKDGEFFSSVDLRRSSMLHALQKLSEN